MAFAGSLRSQLASLARTESNPAPATQRFVLDGDRNELKKIKEELKMLNEMDQGNIQNNNVRTVFAPAPALAPASPPKVVKQTPSWQVQQVQSPPEKSSAPPPLRAKVNSPIANSNKDVSGSFSAKLVEELEGEVARLDREKQNLLATGVFDTDNDIIVELERLYNVTSFKLSEARSVGFGQ